MLRTQQKTYWQLFGMLLVAAIFHAPAFGQANNSEAPKKQVFSPADERARQEILSSDRWRRVQRQFNEWLSVQTLYDEEQVEEIRGGVKKVADTGSPEELRTLLDDTESRLAVLMSPEAEDARIWLSQFFATARNPEQLLGRSRPDVWNMTASQIRQEINWVNQTREQRLQAQANFNRGRAAQSQVARNTRGARQQARNQPINRSDWPANNQRRPSKDAPRPELRPQPLSPIVVGPWGHPVFWNPLTTF